MPLPPFAYNVSTTSRGEPITGEDWNHALGWIGGTTSTGAVDADAHAHTGLSSAGVKINFSNLLSGANPESGQFSISGIFSAGGGFRTNAANSVFGGNILPFPSLFRNLGSGSFSWADLFVNRVDFPGGLSHIAGDSGNSGIINVNVPVELNIAGGGHVTPNNSGFQDLGRSTRLWRRGYFSGVVSAGSLSTTSVGGGGFMDMPTIPTPANPLTGVRRIFVSPDTGKLSVKKDDGSIVSLEEQGGASTAKEAHIDLVSPGEPQTIS